MDSSFFETVTKKRHKYCANGVLNSTPETSFDPNSDVTRVKCSAVLNLSWTWSENLRQNISLSFLDKVLVEEVPLKTVDPRMRMKRYSGHVVESLLGSLVFSD